MIKLDAMENPYGLSGEARAEIAAAVANARDQPLSGRRRRRGQGARCATRSRFRTSVGLDAGQRLGRDPADADDRGRQARRVRARAGALVRAVPDERELANLRFVGVPLRADLTLDIDAMLAAIARTGPRWCGSRFPTIRPAPCFRDADVERIIAATPGWSPSTRRITRSRTRRSCRACSSSQPDRRAHAVEGRAGRRAARATPPRIRRGSPSSTRCARRTTSTSLTQAVVPVLLRHASCWPSRRRRSGASARDRRRARRAAPGHRVSLARQLPARARARRRRAGSRRCGTRGILVKNVDGWHPLLANCLRITVGTPAENNASARRAAPTRSLE